MDTTIDTLAIEIETEAGKSFKNIDALIKRLDKLNASLTQLTTHYSKVQNVIKGVNNIKIKDVKVPKATVQKATKSKVVDTGNVSSLLNKDILTSTEKIVKIDVKNKNDIDDVDKKLKDVDNKTKETKKDFDKFKKSINAVSATGKGLSKLNKILNSTSTGAKKVEEAFKKSFAQSITGSVKKFGLAMIGVRSLFTALRASVQEYMQYDTQLEDTLRNNWAVLGSLLAPALEKIIQLFGIAVAYVRAFIKALTGVDLVAKANKKSMDAVGESAKKTLGNLAKFDNLNVVEFPSTEGSGNDIPPLTTPEIDTKNIDWFVKYIKEGNWYGLGMEIGRKFNDGLRTIDFDWFTKKAQQWATNIADLFNGLTDGIDWILLGSKLAGGLNTIVAFVNTFFERYNWDVLGRQLATGLNSMFDNINWEELGKFFANKFRALIEGGFEFVNTFDFAGLGQQFGTGINSFVESIDWGKAGETIIKGLLGLITTITSTLSSIEWGKLGEKISNFIIAGLSTINNKIKNIDWEKAGNTLFTSISDFIKNIKWDEITSQFSELLGGAIAGSALFMGGFVEDVVDDIADYLDYYVDEEDSWYENGKSIIEGIKKGMKDHMLNMGSWIDKNIFVPFVTGFADIFGIEYNESSVMKDNGQWLLRGLKAGLTNGRSIVYEFGTNVGNGIVKVFKDAWGNIKKEWSKEKVGKFFGTIGDVIRSKFSSIGTTAGKLIGNNFGDIINKIIGFAEDKINSFIKKLNKAIDVINKIPGVEIKKLTTINIPDIKLATGTNRIESEGLYHLHKNEAVVPEKYNPAVNDDLYNNKGVIEALGMVYDAINNLSTTNIVNLGNKTLYKETIKYAKNQNEIYGENVMSF